MQLRSSRLPRSLFAVAITAVVAVAQPRTANACEPSLKIVPVVSLAPRAVLGATPISVPKNAGIVFHAQLNTRTEAEAKAMVTIAVRSGTTLIPGTLQSVGRVANLSAFWRWVPEGGGELPVGPLAIAITVEDWTNEDSVTVEDRSVAAITPAFTVSAERQLVADDSAPKISCNDASSGCGGTGRRTVSTRALASASVSVALPVPSKTRSTSNRSFTSIRATTEPPKRRSRSPAGDRCRLLASKASSTNSVQT